MARSIFTITSTTDNAKPDQSGHAEVTLTVTNTSGRNLRGRAKVVPQDPNQASWFKIAGNAERDFTIGATLQFTVRIDVPKDAKRGKYAFRLDALSTELPDEEYTQGPNISIPVAGAAAPDAHKKTFPVWLIPVLAIVLLLVLGGGGYLIYYLLQPGTTKTVTVNVPNVVGEPVTEAESVLTANKLTTGTISYIPGLRINVVTATSPTAGTAVATGSKVDLTVTKRLIRTPEPVPPAH
jgi:PASTA domain